jgi:hypothetical protein
MLGWLSLIGGFLIPLCLAKKRGRAREAFEQWAQGRQLPSIGVP